MMKILTATRWNALLDYYCFMKSCGFILIIYHAWGSFFFGAYSHIHHHHMDGKLQAHDLLGMAYL
jgi:hypothetical protein